MNYVVATIKSWNIENFHELRKRDPIHNWILIDKKEDLTIDNLRAINPRYIFFPHWSWIIPADVHTAYECVVFHETDLPYGRGGSPIQNLIARGDTVTKVSALRVTDELDAGDVYMKADLSLDGTVSDILQRSSKIIFRMISDIVSDEPCPIPQNGEPTIFKRRKPEDGDIFGLTELSAIYNTIRMLDGEGYPPAFLETPYCRYEFIKARHDGDTVVAEVKITLKVYK